MFQKFFGNLHQITKRIILIQSVQKHDVDKVADHIIIKAENVLNRKQSSVTIDMKISNTDRSFGALISGEIAKKFGFEGLK